MEYRRVDMGDGDVRYVSVPDEPLQSLRCASTEKICEASMLELQSAALAEARNQALAETYQAERWSKADDDRWFVRTGD